MQTAINAGLDSVIVLWGFRERTTRTVWRQSLCTGYERMPALVTIKRIGKEEKMRTKRKKQIIWEVIILFVLVAAAVGAVQFKRIHEQKMAEKNAVQKVKSVDDLAGRKIGVQIGTTGDIYSTDYAKENKGTKR